MSKDLREDLIHTGCRNEKRGSGIFNAPMLKLFSIVLILIVTAAASSTIAYLAKSSGPVINVFAAATKYTLTYHENDGQTPTSVTNMPSPKNVTVYGEGKFQISDKVPVRSGYRFVRWNTKANGNGTSYAASTASEKTILRASQSHTDLYAIWEQDKYTLIYDANGGTIDADASVDESDDTASSHTFTIKSDSAVGLSHPNTAKVFMGWAESPIAEVPKYGFEKKGIGPTGDAINDLEDEITLRSTDKRKVLYAVWGNLYILRFDPNLLLGGFWANDSAPLLEMRAMSPSSSHTFHIPPKANIYEDEVKNYPETNNNLYHFAWWATAPDRYDASYESEFQYGQPVTLHIDGTGEGEGCNGKLPAQQTLYAIYQTSEPAQLIYKSNEPAGAGNAKASNMPASWAGSSQERYIPRLIPSGKPELNNYIFLGYSEDPASRDPEFQPGDWVKIINAEKNNKIVLYAIWRPMHTFRIHFHFNNSKVSGKADGVYRIRNGSWQKATDATSFYYTDGYGYSSDATYTTGKTDAPYKEWDKSFWRDNGLYATKETTPIDSWEFLGWSTDKNATTAEYEVDSEGHLKDDIKIECHEDDCVGTNHDIILWAVWKRTPLHTFKLIFAPNYSADIVVNRNTGINTGYDEPGGGTIYSIKKSSTGGTISIYQWRYDIYRDGPHPISKGNRIWTKEELRVNGPLATKAATSTATYKLKGWSYEPRSSRVDVPVDDDGYITEDIEVYEPHAGGTDTCDGGIHNLLLFPVWESIPQHKFNVIFAEAGTSSNLLAYDDATEQWVTNKGTSTSTYTNGGSAVDLNNKSQTLGKNNRFSSDTLSAETTQATINGPFRMKMEKAATTTSEWEFLGWTETRNKATPDYLVDNDGYLTDLEGNIVQSFTIDEDDDARGHCLGKTAGVEHNIILYPVFKMTPRNTYRLIFATDYNYARVHYDIGDGPKTASLTYTDSKTTVKPDGTVYNAGRTDNVLQIEGGTYIAEEHRTHSWQTNGWKMTASRDSSSETRYVFKGWSYNEDRSTIDIPVDENGVLLGEDGNPLQSISITDPYNYTDKGGIYYVVLWAVFEPETVHRYNLYLDRNFDGNHDDGFVHFKNASGNWTYDYKAYDRVPMIDGTVEQDRMWGTMISSGELSASEDHFTWYKDTFWSDFGAYATRKDTVNYKYKFLGWAYDKTKTTPDIPVELDAEGRGFITEDVTINEPSVGDCAGGVHNMALYAVWQPIPNTRTYSIKYLGNGSGKPPTTTLEETYDEENGWQPEQTLTLGAEIPVRDHYAFMGWSTTNNDILATYGHQNTTSTNELKDLTANLIPTYTIPAPTGNSATVNMYPVWWHSFELNYDANGGTGGPATTHGYGATNKFTFDIKTVKPTREGYEFLGWAEKADATEPKYFTPDPGQPLTDENRVKDVTAGGNGYGLKTIYAVWKDKNMTGGE